MKILSAAMRRRAPAAFSPLTLMLLMGALAGFTVPLAWSADSTAPLSSSPVTGTDYMIIVTGEELLRGVYPDGHTYFLTRTLRPLGCRCVGVMNVDDNQKDLEQALAFASQRAPLIMVTGGLGPTANDITRETLSGFTGIKLQERPEVIREMERRFHQSRQNIRENLRRQTQVPIQGTYLKNAHGTAVGLVFENPGTVIVALPGPPKELQPMVLNELVPYLRDKFGLKTLGRRLTLRFVGVGQSQIDQVLRDHVRVEPDVVVTSLFEGSRVDFIFALPGNSPQEEARLKQIEKQMLDHLGDYFYADDDASLEQKVVDELRQKGASLTLMEVTTGGDLAHSLSQAREIDTLLIGALVAPTEKRFQQLLRIPEDQWNTWKPGEDRLKKLGEYMRTPSRSTWVVVVGEVTSPQNAGRYCRVAFGFPDGRWEVQQLAVRGTDSSAQARLTTEILDRLRRLLR